VAGFKTKKKYMFDYLTLQGSTENPTLLTISFTVVLAFLLSSLIVYTYQKTTNFLITPVGFLQALILVSIVAAMVMQAIGDSLARGLGMLGALAIIRFRTTLREPRNMVFTFASLAAGIACGVYGFIIGIVGTVGFCITAFILKFSPLNVEDRLTGILTFRIVGLSDQKSKLDTIMSRYCRRFVQVKQELCIKEKSTVPTNYSQDPTLKYKYKIFLDKKEDLYLCYKDLVGLGGLNSLKLNFVNLPESV